MLRLVPAVIVVVVVLFAGMWLGGHSSVLPNSVQELVADDQVAAIDDALTRVEDDFYRDVGKDELTHDAIRGAIQGLGDRFSFYLDPKDYDRFRERTEARFSGIGVTVVQVEHGLRISQVYDKSPAQKAGLRVGDVIVAADGQKLEGKSQDAATGLIKGPEGTKVLLTLRRAGKELRKRVGRAEISIPLVTSERRKVGGERIAYVRLESFSTGAHADLYKALREAERDDVKGIVFDLRSNPGGLVDEARLVASAFLEEGEIVTTRGRT
ncbi:MAG TPA: S41 family peptidase, partial [Actinomycetota bacterium]|nr:S41 family peptidase [Actinomycetota bacterium]